MALKKAQDVELVSGDDKDLTVTVTDNNDAAVDLSGVNVTYRLATVAGVTVFTKYNDSTVGIEITDAVNGILVVHISSSDTASLSGIYRHEIEITDVLGNKGTILIGLVKILEDLIV